MSAESLPVPARKPRPWARLALKPALLDMVLIGAFLALTFLLGAFPLRDADFWWHLRTGDLIRQTGQVPQTDLYTYTVADHRWINLHWGYQVALSWGYARGGVVVLSLAKCVITSAAVLLLVTARRRDWPVWVMLLTWLPALLVLAGRMFIRPETLTLLYLALDLAILFRWERYPWLALLLPLVQVAWVNSHGLFVLGLILIAFAILDALCRSGALAAGRRHWWRMAGAAALLSGLACLVNPYGVSGALFPLELARAMSNPLFARTVAELTPIPLVIQRSAGWHDLPLQLHMATVVLGGLSFLIPMVWIVTTRFGRERDDPARKRGKAGAGGDETGWRLSPMRLLLFVAFSALSWRATRNSHQFAAMVGTVTAWNFAEWAAAIARRGSFPLAPASRLLPRLATLGAIIALFVLVASGRLNALTGEGRTIGLGEEPLWFPHAAVEFAGRPEMPARFLSFHEGYAALYEYHNGPGHKVFIDPRLQVVGAELYERYVTLARRISEDQPGWTLDLDAAGRPVVMVGHADYARLGASFLAHPEWRCIWFDPMVAVYIPRSNTGPGPIAADLIDLGARHFAPDPATDPHGVPALSATADALWQYAQTLQARSRPGLARPLVLLGLDYAWRVTMADPNSRDGWKLLGKLEILRDPIPTEGPSVRRYRLPFNPVHDLSLVRATYALRRSHQIAPRDFLTLLLLKTLFELRGMDEAEMPLVDELRRVIPIKPEQALFVKAASTRLKQLTDSSHQWVPPKFENLSDPDKAVVAILEHGRVRTAAELLERAYPSDRRPWEVTDRLGTLWLHLGEPARAREVWKRALHLAPATHALRTARIAATHLVEGDLTEARRQYSAALATDSQLFEAHYGLAVVEQDTGRADLALAAAKAALANAPDDVARSAAGAIITLVRPYAEKTAAPPPRDREQRDMPRIDTP